MSPRPGETRDSEEPDGDWPQVLSFVLLVGAILAVLIAGALLRTDAPGSDPAQVRRPAAPPLTPATPVEESLVAIGSPLPELPAPETELDRMARRSSDDLTRLAASTDGWTAQIGVFCDPSRVARLVEGFGDRSPLLVLPSYVEERACFRICWNRYGSRVDAQRAEDMPAMLRDLVAGDPLARQVTEVLE